MNGFECSYCGSCNHTESRCPVKKQMELKDAEKMASRFNLSAEKCKELLQYYEPKKI